ALGVGAATRVVFRARLGLGAVVTVRITGFGAAIVVLVVVTQIIALFVTVFVADKFAVGKPLGHAVPVTLRITFAAAGGFAVGRALGFAFGDAARLARGKAGIVVALFAVFFTFGDAVDAAVVHTLDLAVGKPPLVAFARAG